MSEDPAWVTKLRDSHRPRTIDAHGSDSATFCGLDNESWPCTVMRLIYAAWGGGLPEDGVPLATVADEVMRQRDMLEAVLTAVRSAVREIGNEAAGLRQGAVGLQAAGSRAQARRTIREAAGLETAQMMVMLALETSVLIPAGALTADQPRASGVAHGLNWALGPIHDRYAAPDGTATVPAAPLWALVSALRDQAEHAKTAANDAVPGSGMAVLVDRVRAVSLDSAASMIEDAMKWEGQG